MSRQDYESHLILHHLDDPLRILKWTVDEASMLFLPFLIGMFLEQLIIGSTISLGGFWALRKLKSRMVGGTLKHALYWYLPHTKRHLKKTPPSHIREYLG